MKTIKAILCLFLAGLTACSSSRSQYVWHDVGVQKLEGMPHVSKVMDSWGARPEVSTVPDPMIAPGFLIGMRCLADSKLNGDYRVEFNGDLLLPYGATVNTTGLSLSQLKKKVTERYRPYFKTPADIDLQVKERRYWLDVRGMVEKPGRYLVEPETSLDLVIGQAGGTTKDPAPLYVRIQKGPKMFVFDLQQYYSRGEDHPQILGWLGGEVLFFQKEIASSLDDRGAAASYRQPISMMGEVRKPGEYPLNSSSDFLDSLVQAGGFTERADLDNIEIVRRTGGRKRVFNFSWHEFERAPAPQQGDIVFVHADNPTKGERRTMIAATVIAALTSIVTATVLVLIYDRDRGIAR